MHAVVAVHPERPPDVLSYASIAVLDSENVYPSVHSQYPMALRNALEVQSVQFLDEKSEHPPSPHIVEQLD